MRKRREFTNEFKLEAVKLAERGNVPRAAVAETMGGHHRSECGTASHLEPGHAAMVIGWQ